MNEAWFADRLTLYALLHAHPTWTNRQFAEATHRSIAWVKKWKPRIGTPPSPDQDVCRSRSCARQHPPPRLSQVVIDRILALRDELAVLFNRVVGPKTILYYLHQDPTLKDERVPTSSATIWAVLDQNQRILRPRPRQHQPLDRPPPLAEVEMDFTDVGTVAQDPDPDAKVQHRAEAFNWVDVGSSRPVASRVRDDFHAASVITTCVEIVQELGLPPLIRCDRDSRFVGNQRTDDFPSAFMRLWMNVDVEVDLCPPHQPQRKPYVERYNRTYTEECVLKAHPQTVQEAQAATDVFRQWFCTERPHQGSACGNRPPDVAFPERPALRAVPELVDPDRWLTKIDGYAYTRKVDQNGKIVVDMRKYAIGKAYRGQRVTVQVLAAEQMFRIFHQEQEIKRVPIKGLIGQTVPFSQMVTDLCALAATDDARLRARRRDRKRPRWG